MIQLALLLLGFTSAVAQLTLLRELLSVFYGNELSIGLSLATWLVSVALGSLLFDLFKSLKSKPLNEKTRLFAAAQVVLALLLPAQVFLSRIVRNLAGFLPGNCSRYRACFSFPCPC